MPPLWMAFRFTLVRPSVCACVRARVRASVRASVRSQSVSRVYVSSSPKSIRHKSYETLQVCWSACVVVHPLVAFRAVIDSSDINIRLD